MKKLFAVCSAAALLCAFAGAATAQSAFSVTWPLTQSPAGASAQPSVAAASPQVISPGPAPQIAVFDYFSGAGQRLWSGTTGWIAGGAVPTRYLQFDVTAQPGQQLSVTQVSFNYGAAGPQQMTRSEVRYSVDNWATSTVLAPALAYSNPGFVPYSANLSAPVVPPGGKFSLRILPYASQNGIAAAPAFVAHNNVVIRGRASPSGGGGGGGGSDPVRVQIRKAFNGTPVAGNYLFNITCQGPGGPYTGPNPVAVAFPSPGISTISVPAGAICGIIEAQPPGGSSTPPSFSASGFQLAMGAPWEAKFGPVTGAGVVTVTNAGGKDPVRLVPFSLRKNTGPTPVAGTYLFNVSCTGPNGPYTGPNPVSVSFPNPGNTTVNVPVGSTCTLAEQPPTSGSWDPPNYSGTGFPVTPGAPWQVQVGPVNGPGAVVLAVNRPKGGGDGKKTSFTIRKSTGDKPVAGTFLFDVVCTGPGGPYTGPNPVAVSFPNPGMATVDVPDGALCVVKEQPPAGAWGAAVFSATGMGLSVGGPLEVKVGPVSGQGGVLNVRNQPGGGGGGGGGGGDPVRVQIRKTMEGQPVAGTYLFNITCSPAYTGANPVAVTYPSPGVSTISVPSGAVCGIVETQPAPGWGAPGFSASGFGIEMGAPWQAKFGPVTGGGIVSVNNRPGKPPPRTVPFSLRKNTGPTPVAGTYLFNVSCTGPNGPYTGPNPVSVSFPNPGNTTVNVPVGSTCTLVEQPPTSGSWDPPLFSGSGMNVTPGAPWQVQVGPVNTANGVVLARNQPKKDDGKKTSFTIRKTTGDKMVAGTYLFNVVCQPAYTGPNPVAVTFPNPGFATVEVAAGASCGVTEQQPAGNWGQPVFTVTGMSGEGVGPWEAKVADISGTGGVLAVRNRPGTDDPPRPVRFSIRKTSTPMVAGTYQFNISCTGSGGPYTGPNPVSVTLPSPGVTTVSVPAGSTCNVTEVQPTSGNWDAPLFTGTSLLVQAGAPWQASAGPITSNGGTVNVENRSKGTPSAACPAFIWTANLNVGTMIPSTVGGALNPQTNNGQVEKFCYGDNPANCATYGGLYEWNEALGYGAGNNSDQTGPRVQGICPAGYHIPSDLEFARYAHCLETTVAPTGTTSLATFQNPTNYNWMGSSAPGVGPGAKMKINHGSFTPPWTGSNISGFAALPAGHRVLNTGIFMNLGDWTAFWTATQQSAERARYFVLDSPSSSGRIGRNHTLKPYGMSVRCLKDY